jgi:hypothetical protein
VTTDALQDCLAAEHAAVYGYGVVGGVLSGRTDAGSVLQELAADSYAEHRRRRDDLTDLIVARDVQPAAAEPAYQLPDAVSSVEDCRDLARGLEERCAAVYADAVSRSVDDDRELAARALTACALRGVGWGARPEPFPGVPEL